MLRNLIIVKRRSDSGLNRESPVLILNSHDESIWSLSSLDVNTESENAALHHEIFLTVRVCRYRYLAGGRVWLVPGKSQQHLALNRNGLTDTIITIAS